MIMNATSMHATFFGQRNPINGSALQKLTLDFPVGLDDQH